MSSICSENITIGMYDRIHPNLLALKNNVITGFMGYHYDRFYASRNHRICQFISIHHFRGPIGTVNINRSFVYLAKNKNVDLYARPDDINYINEYIEMSQPVMAEPYGVSQLAKEPSGLDSADISNFITHNQSLIFRCFLGYLITWIIVLIFLRTVYPNLSKKLNLLNTYKLFLFDSDKIYSLYSKSKYIFLAFNFFLFINLTLLNNSIKTDKVVVDTEDLIDSIGKLEDTIKKPCFFLEVSIVESILKSPTRSFLYRVFSDKIKKGKNLCTISLKFNATEIKILKKKGYERYFFFLKRMTSLILLSYLSRDAKKYIVFKKSEIYYEVLYVIYLRKSIEEANKVPLLKKITRAFEAGLYENLFYRIEKGLLSAVSKSTKVYSSIEEFTNDYAKVEVVHFENYRKVFAYLIGFLTFLLIIFGLNKYGLNLLKSKNKRSSLHSDRFHQPQRPSYEHTEINWPNWPRPSHSNLALQHDFWPRAFHSFRMNQFQN